MACCLTAPSHYLNQCRLIISKVQRHSSEGNFTIDTSAINHWNYLENYLSKISLKSPRGQWVSGDLANCDIITLLQGACYRGHKLPMVNVNGQPLVKLPSCSRAHCIVLLYSVGNKITTTTSQVCDSFEDQAPVDAWPSNTAWCRYNTVNFLQNPSNESPIACPWGRDMGLLWFWYLINFWPLLSQCCM